MPVAPFKKEKSSSGNYQDQSSGFLNISTVTNRGDIDQSTVIVQDDVASNSLK